MEENNKREEITRNSNRLQLMRDEISKSYRDMIDSLEERYIYIQRLMSSGTMNESDVDFYQTQISMIYKMTEDCDYEMNESLGIIDNALMENDEELRRLKEEEEQS